MPGKEDANNIDALGEPEDSHQDPYEHMGERVLLHRERFRSTTKTRKSAETRQRIMETTANLMVERGNTVFQMSEISRRCGMSKGALYYYFSDKEDLLQAIFDDEIDVLVHSIDDAVHMARSGEEALHGACRAYAECVRKGGPLAMALVRELVLSRETTTSRVDKSLMHIIRVVSRQLERAKEEGVIRPDVNASLTAISVCGAYAFAALLAADGAKESISPDFAETMYQTIVRGVGIQQE